MKTKSLSQIVDIISIPFLFLSLLNFGVFMFLGMSGIMGINAASMIAAGPVTLLGAVHFTLMVKDSIVRARSQLNDDDYDDGGLESIMPPISK